MTSFTPARGQQLKERSSIATSFFLDQQSVTPASAVGRGKRALPATPRDSGSTKRVLAGPAKRKESRATLGLATLRTTQMTPLTSRASGQSR